MRNVPKWNLLIWKGAPFSEKITCLQYKNGPAVDFSSLVVTAHIREYPDFSSALIAEFTIPSISDGIIYLTLTKSVTELITYSRGYYDVIVGATGEQVPWLQGEVVFEDIKTYESA